jgi:hypothetical protein
VQSFCQFVVSEFLLISMWTWFKSPDDFFAIYNNLPVRKFSIFQKIVGEEESASDKPIKRKTSRLTNNNNSELDPAREYDRMRENSDYNGLKESILSQEGVKELVGEDYARGTSVDRRSF